MDKFQEQICLLFSLPIYLFFIPLELLLSHFNGWKLYSGKETLMNVYLNIVNYGVDLLLRGVALFVLIFLYQYHLSISWNPFFYWFFLFICEDFLFWLEHFVDHHVRLFWASHVTHHSSEEYNLTTGFRSSVFMPFYRYLYFTPLALLGFRPIDILFMYAITQLYGILVHTQMVKQLPRWLGYIIVTPAHHRVHHASNVPYLDKNMGMVLIIWDRFFGTFAEELPEELVRYGLVKSVGKPKHPTHIIFHEWQALGRDLRKKTSFANKLKYLFMPPGWSHDGSTQTAKQMRDALK
ncbi:MAG: sterol desaturase family protein [Phycisphaerales bacterium]|nr:sterol desaturase family protein [Phycisphaerales bacterium]